MATSEERPTDADRLDYYSAPQSPSTPVTKPAIETEKSNRDNIHILIVIGIGLCCGIAGCYLGSWRYALMVEPTIAEGLTNDVPDFNTPFWSFIGFFAGTILSTTMLILYRLRWNDSVGHRVDHATDEL